MEDFKYARNLFSCRCNSQNCFRFDPVLCDKDYNDTPTEDEGKMLLRPIVGDSAKGIISTLKDYFGDVKVERL